VPLGSPSLLLLALLAQAGAPGVVPVRVDFEAPAGCADGDAFFRGVLARASHVRRAHPGESAVRLGVHLSRAAGRVHGELRMSSTGGESETRRVDGASCAEVVQVLALTAALAIDPMARFSAPPAPEKQPLEATPAPSPRAPPAEPAAPGPAPAPPAAAAPPPIAPPPSPSPAPVASPVTEPPLEPAPPPPPPVAPPPTETVVVARSPEPRTTGAAISVAAAGARVLASTASLGASLSGRYTGTVRGLTPSIALGFLYLAGDFFHDGDDLGLRYSALAVTVCPGWALVGAVVVEPCARLTAGLLDATDHSVTNPRSVDRWWGTAGVLLRGAVRLGAGLTLDLEAGVDFSFVTRHFVTTTPAQPVGETTAVSPAIALGLSHPL
jgi:hypothetical protein